MISIFSIIFFAQFILIIFTCSSPESNVEITSIHQKKIPNKRAKRGLTNLRILVHYDESFYKSENNNKFKNNVIEPAIKFWEESLIVKYPAVSPILIDRSCPNGHRFDFLNGNRIKICKSKCLSLNKCSHFVIPEQYMAKCYYDGDNDYDSYGTVGEDGTGAVDTDLIILISYKSQGCTETSLAYSMTCNLENDFNRPVLGSLNICPNMVNSKRNIFMAISIIKHEIIHILGFNAALYAFFRDTDGKASTSRDSNGYPDNGSMQLDFSTYYKPSEKVLKEEKFQAKYRGISELQTRYILVTPNIKKEAQEYFNCSILKGIYLENFEGRGTLSHFEKRILYNELMTSTIQDLALVSKFTMAFLEDTGWYQPDYSKVDKFLFAKYAGCDFVMKTCHDYMEMKLSRHQPISPYCNESAYSGNEKCSEDLKYKSHCNLRQESEFQVPSKHHYFNNDLVSHDPYSDYCPYYAMYQESDSQGIISNGICTDPDNKSTEVLSEAFETYGSSSACFEFEYIYRKTCFNRPYKMKISAICYRYLCSRIHRLLVSVNGFQYQCKYDGQIIDIKFKTKSYISYIKLKCPKCSTLCNRYVCDSYFTSLIVGCSDPNGRCFNDTSFKLQCSGFQMKKNSLYLFYCIVFFYISRFWKLNFL